MRTVAELQICHAGTDQDCGTAEHLTHGLAEIVPDIGAALWVVDLDVQATHLASEASEPRRQSVQKPAWSDRLCLQIVILFLSNGRVISLAPPAGRVPCRSIIRITRHLAMPNFCGMRVVAFPTGMIGCKAVSKMGIAYVSSVHYRSYAAAAASIRRTEWNDGLLGSLFLSFRQRDPCGRGSESSLRGSDSCGSTMTIKRAMRT